VYSESKHYIVDATRSQRKRMTKEHLAKRSGEENADSGLQVQLYKTSDLWLAAAVTRQVK